MNPPTSWNTIENPEKPIDISGGSQKAWQLALPNSRLFCLEYVIFKRLRGAAAGGVRASLNEAEGWRGGFAHLAVLGPTEIANITDN